MSAAVSAAWNTDTLPINLPIPNDLTTLAEFRIRRQRCRASLGRDTGDSHWGTHPLCAAQIASPDADSLSLIVGGGLREAQGQSACRNSNTYWGVRLGRQTYKGALLYRF